MFEAQSKRFDGARVFAILGNACLRQRKASFDRTKTGLKPR
jgi:hypothetical protein